MYSNVFRDPSGSNNVLEDNFESSDSELNHRIMKLKRKLGNLKEEHAQLAKELNIDNIEVKKIERQSKKEQKEYIDRLGRYNEMKDLSMNVVQLIATSKNTTMKDILREMGVEEDDK